MKRWKIVSLICLGSVVLLTGFATFVLPGMVKSQAVRRVEAATGRTLGIGGISINPFTLTVTIRDFRFTERGSGETFAAFSSARIAIDPASLYRRAPVVAAACITAPQLRVVRVAANLYNFSDLLKFLPLHPRLSVNNLTIKNGSVDFLDRGLAIAKRHELRKVEITVPFITTMPYYADRYVSPRLSAVVNGSPFHLEGSLRPFPRAVEATFNVEFKDASLPFYLSYLPVPLPVRVESGSISSKLALTYRAAQKADPELLLSGAMTLDKLQAADLAGAPLLAVTHLDAKISRLQLPTGDFDLSSLAADGLEVYLKRDRQGVWNHSRLLAKAPPGASPHRKILAGVTQTRFRNGRLHFTDSLAPGGFTTDLKEVSLDMQDYSTSPGKRANFSLSFNTRRGERAKVKGEFSPRPLAVFSQVQLAEVPLEAYYPYFAWAERSEVKGRFAIAGNLDFDGPQGLRLEKVSVQAKPFTTLVGGKARIARASLSVAGGRYSRNQNLLEVADAGLRGGEIRFSRDRLGGLRPLTARYLSNKNQVIRKRGGSVPPFHYRIGQLTGTGLNAIFTDEMLATRPSFALEKVDFSLQRLNGPRFGPAPFRAAGLYGEKGALSASGTLTQIPWNVAGKLTVKQMPLADFGSYLPKKFRTITTDGRIDAHLAGSLSSGGHHLAGNYSGSADIHSLYCSDAEGGELLKVDEIRMNKMKVSLDPNVLDIGALDITRFNSRIVIARNGELNLLHLYPPGPEEKTQQAAAVSNGHVVRIGTVTMRDGTLAFSDHHVRGGYTATLFNLGGRISGLSSEENRLAELDLHANMENRSPLNITGQISPLSQNLFADIKVSFTGIELPPMTPYSGTYLGYAVDRGKLYLDSRYRIVNRKLDSQNHIFIDQLDLGKSIESDKATNLPVRLAVALLKDRKGEIRLDLPVLGQTDDPHFSVWSVVLKTLKGLVIKAASSPFALFQAMFGVKEDLSSVGFAPGSAALSLKEQEKLLKLATALNDRPALQVKVVGFVDRDLDAAGYRGEMLRKKMQSLADARAAGVRAFLVGQGGIASARVTLKNGDLYRVSAQGGAPGSRVELEIAAD
jgi:hypothetical protein